MSPDKSQFELKTIADKLCLVVHGESVSVSPLFIDLIGGELAHKAKNSYGRKDIFAKAIGIKHKPQTALDLTAGFLADTHHLVHLGLKVTCLEKNLLIAELIADAIKRARAKDSIYQELEFQQTDCRDYLNSCTDKYDVIFFDPMFPIKKKQALPSKFMQVLHELSPPEKEPTNTQIIELALQCARQRVVVKRPLAASKLKSPVNVCFKGKAIRYDVYLP